MNIYEQMNMHNGQYIHANRMIAMYYMRDGV